MADTFIFVVLGGVVLFVAVIFAILYNSLVGKKNQVQNAFASVDVQLKKRYDLIPNLVATVEKYMTHERDTLTKITELRAKALARGTGDDEKVELAAKIGGMMRDLLVAVENYPDLKASQNFLQLQGSLNEVEEQISAARRAYNASVLDYNNACEMLPTNILASVMGYRKKPFFEADEKERENVNVKNLFSQ